MQSPLSTHKSPWIVRTAVLSLIVFCTVMILSQSVFAKTTYVITDGDEITIHSTFETNPAEVLTEAGVELNHKDTFTHETVDGISEITVQRGQHVIIDLFGEKMDTIAYSETVGALLERLNLNSDGKAQVSAPLNAIASEGMVIRIFTTELAEDTYYAEEPFETIYQQTDYLKEGTEVVLTEGHYGQKLCTVEVTLINGKETNRVVVKEEITIAPTAKIVAVGTGNGKPKTGAPIIGDGVIITPEGKVLNYESKGTFDATAYMTMPPYTYDITATGTKVHKGTVAVDPTVIPYGTKMYIVSVDGKFVYGEGTAEDCGPAIKNDRLDLFYFTFNECAQFGRRDVYVFFLTD
jgi:uncharacterized protein YabE (DUF348 family)/3D (Asp-Asp-Asp) domain-containing protein